MHLSNHIQNPHLVSDSTLHVIGVCTNPVRWQSRYRMTRQWMQEMSSTPNVRLYMVEAAYGDRHFEVTDPANPDHLQLFSTSEIWLKENLINLAVRRLLPRDWKYMAWVDADVHFRNPGWALATIHQLQHYPVLQPWRDAVDLDHHGGIFQSFRSFGYYNAKAMPKAHHKTHPYGHPYAHSGFAWACTRFFYENVERLLDFSIIGAADHGMAWAMVGEVARALPPGISAGYKRRCLEWQEKAHWACGGNVGFVDGRIEHSHHGPKKARGYFSRWEMLSRHGFDPDKDLTYDSQGLLQLRGQHLLEQDIMRYNRSRMEDSLESY